mmetsp:Transcript_39224/g.84432  ORF Transcript_39224/g.84432 Transcript_39224/m.84432 type:complete len:206 (-) Transcript_39224:277-894(-)
MLKNSKSKSSQLFRCLQIGLQTQLAQAVHLCQVHARQRMALPASGTQPLHGPRILLASQAQGKLQHGLWVVLLFRLNLQRNALPVTTSGCPGRTFATTQDVEQAPTTSKAVVEAIGGTVVRVLRLLPGHIKEPPSSSTLVFPATVQEPRIHQQRSPCWTRGQFCSPELLRGTIRPRQDAEPLLEVGIIMGPWKQHGRSHVFSCLL